MKYKIGDFVLNKITNQILMVWDIVTKEVDYCVYEPHYVFDNGKGEQVMFNVNIAEDSTFMTKF